MQYTIQPLNKEARLIEQRCNVKGGFVEIIYGEYNDGTNQGLEVYFYKHKNKNKFYTSRGWPLDEVPKKYESILLQLRLWVVHCPAGHKLTLA